MGARPDSDPFWPGFIRYRVAPTLATQLETQPSMQKPDWYGYCGPGPAGTAAKAIQWLQNYAFNLGFWVYAEFIHVHPSTPSYPWPPTNGVQCGSLQWETRRPRAYGATWDGQTLKYALYDTGDTGPEGRMA